MKDVIIKSPLVYSLAISCMVDAEVYLKLENLQKTGSFKLRGATCNLLLTRISGLQANVLNIHRERVAKTRPLNTTRVEMETRSRFHIDTIVQERDAKDYRIELKL